MAISTASTPIRVSLDLVGKFPSTLTRNTSLSAPYLRFMSRAQSGRARPGMSIFAAFTFSSVKSFKFLMLFLKKFGVSKALMCMCLNVGSLKALAKVPSLRVGLPMYTKRTANPDDMLPSMASKIDSLTPLASSTIIKMFWPWNPWNLSAAAPPSVSRVENPKAYQFSSRLNCVLRSSPPKFTFAF